MPTPVDIRITLSLHADTLKEVDGYDEEFTAPILAPALEALDDAYITLGKLHDARDAAKKNQAWTEVQQVLAVSDAAWKQQQRIAKKFDNVRVTLEKQIAHFEQELSQPLESRAAVTISGEVLKFVKDMPTEKRHEFLTKAIEEGAFFIMSRGSLMCPVSPHDGKTCGLPSMRWRVFSSSTACDDKGSHTGFRFFGSGMCHQQFSGSSLSMLTLSHVSADASPMRAPVSMRNITRSILDHVSRL